MPEAIIRPAEAVLPPSGNHNNNLGKHLVVGKGHTEGSLWSHSSTTHDVGGSDISGTVKFIPGLISRSIRALLEVVSIMTQIIRLSIKLGKDMVDVQGDLGLFINEACKLQGQDAFNQALCQGIPAAVGGAATFAVGGYASRPADCGEIDAQIGGLKQYEMTLDAAPEMTVGDGGAPQRGEHVDEMEVQKRLQEIQDGKDFAIGDKAANPSEVRRCLRADGAGHLSDEEVMSMASPEERARIRKSFNKHNTSLRDRRTAQMRNHLDKGNTSTAVASGLSSTFQGIGGSVSSRYQQDQKDEEGQAALGQSTQNISQGLSGQFRGGEDKRESELNAVLQQAAAIANANMIASAA